MGMYNEYYKKYYSSIGDQSNSKVYSPRRYSGDTKVESYNRSANTFPIFLNVFDKRYVNIFIAQCVTTLVLLGGLILYRAYPESDFGQVYESGLKYMGTTIEVEDISTESVVAVFNQVKTLLEFNDKKEEYIRENYVHPIATDDRTSFNVEGERLILNGGAETTIRASYEGKVKSIKDGVVTINYGDGIEMVYHGLEEVNVVEGMAVTSSDILGKVTFNTPEVVAIEILYMGGRLNPINCFNLGKAV